MWNRVRDAIIEQRRETIMPHIDFYLDDDDNKLVTKKLLSLGARLVPDLHYMKREYKEYDSLADIEKERDGTRSFFIVHKDFSHLPLEMFENTGDGNKWFAIMPRNGGPALTLLFGGNVKRDETVLIRPGNIGYYRTYWDPFANCNQSAPVAEKELFVLLQHWTKQNFTRLQGRRTYWLGPGAVKHALAGSRLVGFENLGTSELGSLLDLNS